MRFPKNVKLKKITLILILLTEFILILLLLTTVMRSAVLNRNDRIIFADNSHKDDISCADGKLTVNNVSANVPSTDNASYSISYSWAESDTDYPSIPRAALVSYNDKSSHLLYEISLYRDSFIPRREIPKGKNSSNWFDDWERSDSKDESIKQMPYKTDKINGFLVSAVNTNSDKASSYSVSSYYFATEDKKGISIYILEGVLYREGDKKKFEKVMENSFASIQINQTKQRADELPADDGSDNGDSEEAGA